MFNNIDLAAGDDIDDMVGPSLRVRDAVKPWSRALYKCDDALFSPFALDKPTDVN